MFSELTLVTFIAVSTPVSCYYMTLNYDGKKARNVGVTCRLLVVVFMIFYCILFLTGGNRSFLQHRRSGFSITTITTIGVENLKLRQTKAYGINYLSMRF